MTHLATTRRPMSEARRMHIHGPLQSLADDAGSIGEPSILRGVCVIALPVIVVSAMIVAFT